MNSKIDLESIAAQIEPFYESVDQDGNSLPMAELCRIRLPQGQSVDLVSSEAGSLYERFAALKGMSLNDYIELVLEQLDAFITDAAIFADKHTDYDALRECMNSLEMVLFRNGVLLVLPAKEWEEATAYGYNPGWSRAIKINFKSLFGASCWAMLSHLLSRPGLFPELQDTLSDTYYAVREVCYSKDFDLQAIHALLD